MIVTRHTRWIGFRRLIDSLQLASAGTRITLDRLEAEWQRRCGLRRDDLRTTLNELSAFGYVQLSLGGDGLVMGLTDLGNCALQRESERYFDEYDPRSRLWIRFNTVWALFRAGLRADGSWVWHHRGREFHGGRITDRLRQLVGGR